LANEGARGVEQLRREYRKLLYEMSSRKEEAGVLSGAVSLFLKVSKSYWKGLFRSYRFPDLPHQQRPGAPLRLRTLRRAACQWQERSIACDGGAWLGACGRRRGHAPRRVRRSGHTSGRSKKMADLAGFARKETRESPRPATLQAGSLSLPRWARRAATQASFAVLVFFGQSPSS
jgi:hypothetical protein